MEQEYLSNRPLGHRDHCGIGNVILPLDQDREIYMQRCLRTSTISIALENGGVAHRVIVAKHILKDVDFPPDSKTLGSQVIWLNKPGNNQPMIIGLFDKSDEITIVDPNQDNIGGSSTSASAQVIIDKKKGIIIINANSFLQNQDNQSGESVGGDIYIISTNANQNSTLNVEISGSVNVTTQDFSYNGKSFSLNIQDPSVDNAVTSISYVKGQGLTYVDEFNNQINVTQGKFQIVPSGSLNIGQGKEPIPLGTTLQSQIEKTNNLLQSLLNVIEGASIPEPGNGSPSALQTALKAAVGSQTLGDFSNILSKIANTD